MPHWGECWWLGLWAKCVRVSGHLYSLRPQSRTHEDSTFGTGAIHMHTPLHAFVNLGAAAF